MTGQGRRRGRRARRQDALERRLALLEGVECRLALLEAQHQRTVEALGQLAQGQHALVCAMDRVLGAVESALDQLVRARAQPRRPRESPPGPLH